MSKAALSTFYAVSLILLMVVLHFQFRSKDLCITSNNIISVKGPGFDIQNCHEHFRPYVQVVPSYVPSLLRNLESLIDSTFWGNRTAVKISFAKIETPLDAGRELILPEKWLGEDSTAIRNSLIEFMITQKWPEWSKDHFQLLVLRDFLQKALSVDPFYEFAAPDSNFIRSLQTSAELCVIEKENPLCLNPHFNKQSPKVLTIWHFKSLLVSTLYEAFRDSSLFEQRRVLEQIASGVKKLPTPSLPKDLQEIQDWRSWFKETALDFGQSFAINKEQIDKTLYLKGVTGDFGLDTLVIVSSSASLEFKEKLKESLKKKLGKGPWLVVDDKPTQHSPFLLARAQGLRLRQVISYQCGHPQELQAQSYYVQQFDLVQDCE